MERTALVTGGTRGIGSAISEALNEAGFHVAVAYAGNDIAAANFTQRTGIRAYKWDVGDYDSCIDGIAAVEADLGPIDTLVNNAGITRDTMLHKMTAAQWRDVMSTNLDSMFNMCQPLLNGMRERGFGRIVNITSINGQKGQMGQTNYSAAKAGVIGFTKAIAKELVDCNVLVNAVAPVITETDLFKEMTQEHISGAKARIPMGRFLTIREIAALVAWISSKECSFTTGFCFDISGGRATY